MQAEFELAAEFYPLEAIEQAMAAFAQIGPTHNRIRLEPLGPGDPESFRLEFANWVLAASASAPSSGR